MTQKYIVIRGFTGHEIDEVGLVNMNGRIYDPEIGRFMSADPIVQDPTNTQSLNRYSYVGNNPLSYTDPSGYFLKGLFKALIAIAIVVVAVVFGQPWIASSLGLMEGGMAAYAIAGAIGGAIAGGITGGGDLRSILTDAISGAAFSGLGAAARLGHISITQHVAGAGLTGGVTSVVQGGNFQSGFLAAGFSAIAAPPISTRLQTTTSSSEPPPQIIGGDGDPTFFSKPRNIRLTETVWFPGHVRRGAALLFVIEDAEYQGEYVALTSRTLARLREELAEHGNSSVVVHQIRNPTDSFTGNEEDAFPIGMGVVKSV